MADAIRGSEPQPLPGAASPLNRALSRALNKDVAQRYQALSELLSDLRNPAPKAVMEMTRAESEIPSIAVLPFRNMSADPEQEYFCEGLAEELIDALARLDGLRVAARTSAFQFSGKGHDLSEVGRKLNVRTVLEGSVRRAGKRLRVNAQLINAEDGYHLWSERYDRDMDDVFEVQDEIAGSVVERLKVKLLGRGDTTPIKRPTDNLQAYNLFLKGRHNLARFSADGFEDALECFGEAATLEPGYVQAYAGTAVVQTLRASLRHAAPTQVMPIAKDAALKGLELDESVSDPHFALAMVLHRYEWDWRGAEREFRRALELNPGDSLVRSFFADLPGCEGQHDEAIEEARRSLEYDPLSSLSRHRLLVALVEARRFEAALSEAQAAVDLEPAYRSFYWALAWANAGLGRHDGAVTALRQADTLAPGPHSHGQLAWALGLAGQRDEALAIVGDLERRYDQEYVGGFTMAWASMGLGEHDQAIAWLQRAVEERDALLIYCGVMFFFDPLRQDPRFQAILRRVNLPVRV